MQATTTRPTVPLGWKLGLLTPFAAALLILLLSSRQAGLHTKVELTVIGNLLVAVGLAAQGVYWIIRGRQTGLGIFSLTVGSTLFGFGLHTLLRVLGS